MVNNSKEYMKKNYMKYWGNKKALWDRNARTKLRYLLIKKWKVSKGDGKEIDHRNSNPRDNRSANINIISRLKNRIKGAKKANDRRYWKK
jgi:hypothetical protein